MDQEIRKFLKQQGGVMGVNELADLLELDEGKVRRWARENEVRRIGSTFAFSSDTAFACADDLLGDDEGGENEADDGRDDDEDEDESEENDEDDEDDEDDDGE